MPCNAAIFPHRESSLLLVLSSIRFQGQKNTVRNLDFPTTINLTTRLYRSLCALLAKITMVFYSIIEKNVSTSYQRDAAQEFQSHHYKKEKSGKQSQKAALPVVQFSICSSCPLVSLYSSHCHADKPVINR